MPLFKEITLAADAHFERFLARLIEEAKPKPPPKQYTSGNRPLARQSPQPDRLVAVQAARVPMIEAARRLLKSIALIPGKVDAANVDSFHEGLAKEVSAFESICQDACLWHGDITVASYVLCAALDEAASHAPWALDNEETAHIWAGRLSLQFHGANLGGEGFFAVLAKAMHDPARNIIVLELLLLILALGFQGIFRNKSNGPREIQRAKDLAYKAVLQFYDNAGLPSLRVIEHLLAGASYASLSAQAQTELYS